MNAVLKLLEIVDSYVPLPKRELDKPFLLPIEGVYSIAGLKMMLNILCIVVFKCVDSTILYTKFDDVNLSAVIFVSQEGAQWCQALWREGSSKREMRLNLWGTIVALSL